MRTRLTNGGFQGITQKATEGVETVRVSIRLLRSALFLLLPVLLLAGCGGGTEGEAASASSPVAASSFEDYDRADLEDCISRAVLQKYGKSGADICNAEGHVTLGANKKKGIEFVYAIVGFGAYRYENGAFTRESGFDALPVVLLFRKDAQGKHALLECKVPPDGARYDATVRELFPEGEIRRAAEDPARYRETLDAQLRRYLDAYLLERGAASPS